MQKGRLHSLTRSSHTGTFDLQSEMCSTHSLQKETEHLDVNAKESYPFLCWCFFVLHVKNFQLSAIRKTKSERRSSELKRVYNMFHEQLFPVLSCL